MSLTSGTSARPAAAWVIFLTGLLLSAVFVLCADNRWEDFYITYRSSRNLVEGHGLVYQIGECVHSFTSPLGVLLPALALSLTGGASDEVALALFRAWSACALAGACVLLWRTAGQWGWTGPARWVVAILPLLESKTVMFSLNGMETAFMLLFITLALSCLTQDHRRSWPALGLAWAGLMWTRPDGFVFGGATALAWWVFQPGGTPGPSRADTVRAYAKAAGLAMAVYAPWFFWARHYYGSAIPNTIAAKSAGTTVPGWGELPQLVLNQIVLFPWNGALRGIFLPPYAWFSEWPRSLQYWMNGAAWVAVLYGLVPGTSRVGRAASLSFILTSLYAALGPRAPWYLPSHGIMAIIAVASAMNDLVAYGRRHPWARWLAPAVIGVHLFVCAVNLGLAEWHARVQQQLIESQRREIGLWLKAHRASDRDKVFAEPLGYFGYFSQLKMLDSLGLAAPEVVAARRQNRNWSAMIAELQPDWLVLRPSETRTLYQQNPRQLLAGYRLVRRFDVSGALAALPALPGRALLQYDETYDVFHRITPSRNPAPSATEPPAPERMQRLP